MTRIKPLENPTGKAAELLEMVKKKMGRVPNMMQTLVTSPEALEMYLTTSGILGQTSINLKDRERIAILSATKNSCTYCDKAHTAIGKMSGLTDADVNDAKNGTASEAKSKAIVEFTNCLLEKNGLISDADFNQAKQNGLSDKEILEIVAITCLNIYTNFVNHVMDPVVDF
jgi:uncharacterized peroxidase-related enzyme